MEQDAVAHNRLSGDSEQEDAGVWKSLSPSSQPSLALSPASAAVRCG